MIDDEIERILEVLLRLAPGQLDPVEQFFLSRPIPTATMSVPDVQATAPGLTCRTTVPPAISA
jgi:hypothetical protein